MQIYTHSNTNKEENIKYLQQQKYKTNISAKQILHIQIQIQPRAGIVWPREQGVCTEGVT